MRQYGPKPGPLSLKAQTNRYWRGKATLYRFYDASGRLLYVGVSENLPERVRQHRRSSAWFQCADRLVVKVFRTRMDAYSAEPAVIRNEQPLHNVRYGPEWIEPGTRRRGLAVVRAA